MPISAGDVNVSPSSLTIQIATSGLHTCAVLGGGNVRCWGFGIYGQLGYGVAGVIGDIESPASAGDVIVSSSSNVTQIAVGYYHTCVLQSDGDVRCWGYGQNGQLGYGSVSNIGDNEDPVSAGDVNVLSAITVVQVAAGYYHTCTLLGGGVVRCWGSGSAGQLGYGNTNNVGDIEAPDFAGDISIGSMVDCCPFSWSVSESLYVTPFPHPLDCRLNRPRGFLRDIQPGRRRVRLRDCRQGNQPALRSVRLRDCHRVHRRVHLPSCRQDCQPCRRLFYLRFHLPSCPRSLLCAFR
jgi:hypothetical protein